MSGKPGRSGRRKAMGKQIDEAIAHLDIELVTLVDKLVERAKEGDREALIYLIDRRMGRPHQSQDLRIKAAMVSFTPDEYELMTRPSLEEKELIGEYIDVKGQG